MRMNATTSEFKEVASVFNGLCKNFFKKNIKNIMDYRVFLEQSRSSIRDLLFNFLQQGPIKYSIKVESTYEIPNTDVRENRAFKTKCMTLFLDTDINNILNEDFIKIIQEENDMMLKGSDFSLVSIDECEKCIDIEISGGYIKKEKIIRNDNGSLIITKNEELANK
ncbi:hypothetical protein QTP88_028209 [Uroleucon formosanum]